ncbi:unnamed protein product [Soboliphyme baturini]|uniref:C2H2-type domain-containing protein n=1 Tax=Soboliphyme baturini TaxID=241478 RepID=A0A183IE19_9BILA|nr:unnamed protein product [Soboliphyme baturini]
MFRSRGGSCYVGRRCRTPPSFYQKEQSECIDRCESAPSSFDIPMNIAESLVAPTTADNVTVEGRPTSQTVMGSYSASSPVSELSKIEPFISSSACESKVDCEICGKVFSKIGLLRLHMNVHIFERSSRRYDFKCSSCNCGFRSRSLLQKHISNAHPRHEKEDGASATESGGDVTAVASSSHSDSSTASSLNPRPFECVDCSIAFRIHGHLAKHLRSKLHIMKLECLGKIPIGTFARLEEAGVRFFLEIDTSDCQNSLKSLLLLNEKLDASSSSSPRTSDALSADSYASSALKDGSTQTKDNLKNAEVDMIDLNSQSDAISACDADQNRSIVAGLWVPPKVTELAVSAVSDVRNDHDESEDGGGDSVPPDDFPRVSNMFTVSTAEAEVDEDALKKAHTFSQTYCKFCALSFLDAIDLEVHWHADHVVMKDGKDYKCPKDNCDKVYPNKESLRQHIALHFLGRLNIDYDAAAAAAAAADVSKATVVALSRKLNGITNSGGGGGAVCELCDDPGGKMRKRMKTPLVKLNVLPDSPGVEQQQNRNMTNPSLASGMSNCASPISDSDTSRVSASGQSTSPAPSPLDAVACPKTVKCYSSRSRRTPIMADEPTASSSTPVFSKRSGSVSSEQAMPTCFTSDTVFVPMSTSYHDEAKSAAELSYHQCKVRCGSRSGSNSGSCSASASGSGLTSPNPNLFANINQNTVLPTAWNMPSFYANPVSPQPFYLAAAANPLSLFTYQNDQPSSNNLHLISNTAWMNLRAMTPQFAASLYLNSLPKPPLFSPVAANATSISEQSLQSSNNVSAAATADTHFCFICSKQFLELPAFQQHILNHSQLRPFVCEYCDAGFTTWQALESHLPCRFQ